MSENWQESELKFSGKIQTGRNLSKGILDGIQLVWFLRETQFIDGTN